ncbi:MAG: OPT/YSL family transporter [Atopobiaceae bacterium]
MKTETTSAPRHGAGASRACTPRALVIGAVGSVVLTASSLFIALRMGMLPWPIAFAAVVSVLVLRLCGSKNLHEANVAHAAMSAGSMVAGGLAFTIPGLWIMGVGDDLSVMEILAAALGGTILGLAVCSVTQPYFIRRKRLAFPIGISASDTLKAVGASEAADAPALFAGMGFAGVYAVLRDVLGVLPSVLFSTTALPGITFGVYNSPMTVAMGFMVGLVPAFVWFLGAVLGNFGIVWGGQALGMVDATTATSIRVSLGLGMMLGCGAGAIVASLVAARRSAHPGEGKKAQAGRHAKSAAATTAGVQAADDESAHSMSVSRPVVAMLSAAVACGITIALNLNFVASVIVVLGAWFCVYLSAWLVGTTGIDPMEIFGMLVLLLIQAIFHDVPLKTLFLAAAVVAVACGTGGDVMNDLKAGDELSTDPRDQMKGMAVGALVGAVVASFLLMGLYTVYGADAFGPEKQFVAVQAANVAAMAGGIPNMASFVVGLVAGFAMSVAGLPVMTLGLGIYLPFYLSSGAVFGALARLAFEHAHKNDDPAKKAPKEARWQTVASGLMGGESLVGVIVALVALAGMVFGG